MADLDPPTVADEWRVYLAEVLHPDAGPDQVRETRRAFYAGWWALLMRLREIGDDDDVGEEEGVARFESWQAECERFNADVIAGRA